MSEQPAPFAMKCSATGPGLGGGAAGVEAQFTITSADEDGARGGRPERREETGAFILIFVLACMGICAVKWFF